MRVPRLCCTADVAIEIAHSLETRSLHALKAHVLTLTTMGVEGILLHHQQIEGLPCTNQIEFHVAIS